VWLRPANVPAPVDDPHLLIARGSLGADASSELCAALWDLDGVRASLDVLLGEAARAAELLEGRDPALLSDSFIVSVAIARALATEPQLPEELVGDDWPADELRRRYDELEKAHGQVLHEYLKRASLSRH
jgi:phenylacetic acid degradation operon negative regulatory protein